MVLGSPSVDNFYGHKRTPVTQIELNAALTAHERFIRSAGGARAMFKLRDMSGLVLANRRLDDADFTGASLERGNAYGSSFVRTSLYCADLRFCNLRYAKLIHADLRGASFGGADLAGAVLDYADMRSAMMAYSGAGAEFRSHPPENGGGNIDFRNASLRNVSFGNAKLIAPNFSGAILAGARFNGAVLTDAKFDGADLTGVNLSELKVPPEALKHCVTDPTPAVVAKAAQLLEQIEAHARWVESDGRQGQPAVLDGADLRPLNGRLAKRNLVGLSARQVIAIGVDFSGCRLQGAKFDGADLRGAGFADADLSGTSFKSAKLHHARFDRSRLGALSLLSGQVITTCLEEAEVSVTQFRSAIADQALTAFGLQAHDPGDPAAKVVAA